MPRRLTHGRATVSGLSAFATLPNSCVLLRRVATATYTGCFWGQQNPPLTACVMVPTAAHPHTRLVEKRAYLYLVEVHAHPQLDKRIHATERGMRLNLLLRIETHTLTSTLQQKTMYYISSS